MGAVIVRTLFERGAEVIVHYHHSEAEAKELQKSLSRRSHPLRVVSFDLADIPEMRAKIGKLLEEIDHLDGLVCNAAVFFATPFFQVTEEQWDCILNVNLKSTFFLCQQVGKHMMEKGGGKIVLISDVSAGHPWPAYLPYTISKAGINHLARGLAKILAPKVTVNVVAPGTVLPAEGTPKTDLEVYRKKTLLKTLGSPKDVAESVCFLFEHSDFITGAIIPVDGGYDVQGG